MKKIIFTIFIMPNEIDDLERLLIDLNKSSKFVNGQNYEFYIALTLDEYMIDWENSLLKKEFFEERFYKLKSLTSWAAFSQFHIRKDILGCSSLRRIVHKECVNATHFIWLDTDIFFDEKILYYIESGIDAVMKIDGYDKHIIGPECVRIWDDTWDCLVNSKYLTNEIGYCKLNNPFVDSGEVGEVALEQVQNNIIGQPKMKFGGGWFNCLSKSLLDRIPIPENIGHYGPDDTFIMWAAEKLSSAGEAFYQFKLKNYVVCENYMYRNNAHYDKLIKRIDRKQEFRNKANNFFMIELNKLR